MKPYSNSMSRLCMQRMVSAMTIAAASTIFMIASHPGSSQAADETKHSMKHDGAGSNDSMQMHKSMMDGMKSMESMPMTGDHDHDFAMMMKKHHQTGLEMAQMEMKNGKDEKMKAMAKKIISSQQKEIKEFEQWLSTHQSGEHEKHK